MSRKIEIFSLSPVRIRYRSYLPCPLCSSVDLHDYGLSKLHFRHRESISDASSPRFECQHGASMASTWTLTTVFLAVPHQFWILHLLFFVDFHAVALNLITVRSLNAHQPFTRACEMDLCHLSTNGHTTARSKHQCPFIFSLIAI